MSNSVAGMELLDGLADAAIMADESGTIVFANGAAEKLLQWFDGALVGQNLNVIQPTRLQEQHNRAFAAFVARGELESLANKPVRLPARKRNGEEIDIELTLSTTRRDGQIFVIGLLRDLSERVELERQLMVVQQLRAATSLASDLGQITDMRQLLDAITVQLATRFGFTDVGIWLGTPDGLLRAQHGGPMPDFDSATIKVMCDIEHARLITDDDNWPMPVSKFGALLPLCSEGQPDGLIAVFAREAMNSELIEVLNTLTAMLNGNLSNIIKLERERQARQQAERAQADLAFLDRASEQLISSMALDDRMQQLVTLAVPTLGNWAALYRVSDDHAGEVTTKNLRLTNCHHANPDEVAPLRRGLVREGAKKLLQLVRVSDQARPVVISLPKDRFGVSTALVLPMRAREKLTAILVIGNTNDSFSEQQVRIGDELARHAALATDNVRLWAAHEKTAAARAESVGMLKAFFEAAPLARAFLDRRLYLRSANSSMQEMLAASAVFDAARPRPITELLPTLTGEQVKLLRQVLREGKAITDIELNTSASDGSKRHWLMHAYPVLVESQLRGVGLTLSDITKRKQAEADLHHSRDQLAAILHGVADGIVVQDRRGRAVFANPAALTALGYANLAQLQSLAVGSLSEHFDLLDEAGNSLSLWRLPGYDVMRGKKAPERLVHFRAKQALNDRWFWVRASGVRDAEGRLDLIINIFRDVSEARKTTERSQFLATSSALMAESLDYTKTLHSVVEAAVPQLADWCVVDLLEEDQDYTSQPQRLAASHIDPAKIELAKHLEAQSPYDPDAPQGVSAVLRTGRSEIIENIPPQLLEAALAGRDLEYQQAVRSLQLRSYICVPMRSQGRILGALTLVYAESGRHYDANDLQLAEEVASRAAMAIENARLYQRAQASIREREDFLAIASHELRTPVTVVRAYSQSLLRWLERMPAGESEVKVDRQRVEHQLRNINEGTTRLTALIEQLLDITALQAQEEKLDLASVNLDGLLQTVAEDARLLQKQGRFANVSIDLAMGEDIYGLWDASRLQRVFTNLLDNALKYSPDHDEVSIRAWSEDEGNPDSRIHITFKDNGLGVPPAEHYSIFEPFKRASNASTRNYSGFGMGLAVSRQIIDLHGGRIWVESRGNSLGSIFHIVLPRLSPEIAP